MRQKVRHPTNGPGVGQRCNAQGELSLVLVNLFGDSKQKIVKRTADRNFSKETEMRNSAKFLSCNKTIIYMNSTLLHGRVEDRIGRDVGAQIYVY
jgi:hypothetical protein